VAPEESGSDIAFHLGVHLLDAPCHVCGLNTRQSVHIDFPTRARGAAVIARADGKEPNPDDGQTLKPVPMQIQFACHAACLEAFWPLIGEAPPGE
jgi:hypothetical protein